MNKVKFRRIVQTFVDCLDERFDTIEDTITTGNFNKLSKLCNRAPVFLDATTGNALKWIMQHEGTLYGTEPTATG